MFAAAMLLALAPQAPVERIVEGQIAPVVLDENGERFRRGSSFIVPFRRFQDDPDDPIVSVRLTGGCDPWTAYVLTNRQDYAVSSDDYTVSVLNNVTFEAVNPYAGIPFQPRWRQIAGRGYFYGNAERDLAAGDGIVGGADTIYIEYGPSDPFWPRLSGEWGNDDEWIHWEADTITPLIGEGADVHPGLHVATVVDELQQLSVGFPARVRVQRRSRGGIGVDVL